MNRFDAFIDALEAAYAGETTTWFKRAEDAFRHDNWDRIVAYPSDGTIVNPDVAAQGWDLDTLPTPAESGAVDDLIWVRRVTINLGIWAGTYEQAENRLHALLVAIAEVIGTSNLQIDSLAERWIRSEAQDLTPGGALVVLSFVATFYVLASDVAVLETEINTGTPGDLGTGIATSVVDTFAIELIHQPADGSDEETIYIIEEET